jgi:DNA-binding transcriptional ArsR family regulator
MTSNPSNPSTSTAAMPQPAPSVAKVLAALHRLGGATAAAIATEAGLGYSTTTPKLRSLETAGLAESTRSDTGRSLWRLTDAGRVQAEQGGDHDQSGSEPFPSAAAATDAPASDAAAPQGPHGGDAQETGGATGQNHDQRSAAANPTDGRPDAAQPASLAPGDGEAPQDDAREPDNTGTDDDRSTAEPEVPTATDGTNPAAAALTTGESDAGMAADSTTGDPAEEGSPTVPPAAEPAREAPEAGTRRASGTLRGAILDILEANPGKGYKVSELCKLVDRANEGTGAKKASAGAVHNAAVKLVGTGQAVLAAEKPATFALADPAA